MTYQSVNPNTGKTLKSFEHFNSAQLENSLAAAEACFRTWKHTSYTERAVVVAKAAALMHAHVDDYAKLATLEMGKRIGEARGEVKFSADILAYYAKHTKPFWRRRSCIPKLVKPTWRAARSASSSASNLGISLTTSSRASPARSSWRAIRWWSSMRAACRNARSRSRSS